MTTAMTRPVQVIVIALFGVLMTMRPSLGIGETNPTPIGAPTERATERRASERVVSAPMTRRVTSEDQLTSAASYGCGKLWKKAAHERQFYIMCDPATAAEKSNCVVCSGTEEQRDAAFEAIRQGHKATG